MAMYLVIFLSYNILKILFFACIVWTTQIKMITLAVRVCADQKGGGWETLCMKKRYSEPRGAESREGSSTLAESSRVT